MFLYDVAPDMIVQVMFGYGQDNVKYKNRQHPEGRSFPCPGRRAQNAGDNKK